MEAWMPPLRYWVLAIFVASALYAHFRGKVRFGLVRALTDFTVLLAPVNALLYLGSKVPAKAFLNPRTSRPEAAAGALAGDPRGSPAPERRGLHQGRRGLHRHRLQLLLPHRLEALLPEVVRRRPALGAKLCPRTVELVNQIPGIKAAMFTSLPPGARLVRHRDPFAGSIRYHLGLVTPNSDDCFIEVDGERRSWHDGEPMMFDETFIHYAENKTDHQRVILFCDVERPVYTAPLAWFNRFFGRIVLNAARTQNVEGESIGLVNKIFAHGYKLRLAGKALKAKSRPTYYVLKWVAILGALYLIFR
jgi:beta-hydroxylase